jgi:phospholipase C
MLPGIERHNDGKPLMGFGVFGRGDSLTLDHDKQAIQTNPYANGTEQRAFRMPNTCQLPSQPSQE